MRRGREKWQQKQQTEGGIQSNVLNNARVSDLSEIGAQRDDLLHDCY